MLVEFGRRQALGMILGTGDVERAAPTPKPIVDRVRADGPLLPPLTLSLARWIAEHYLAPPALVIRSMLPPGPPRAARARRRTYADGRHGGVARRRSIRTCSNSSSRGRDLPASSPRPTAARGCSGACALSPAAGLVTLDWTLLGASGGPRYERWIG